MPQDRNLYGQPPPKKRKKNIGISSSLDFTSQLTSLLSNPSASNSSSARTRTSKAKENILDSTHDKAQCKTNKQTRADDTKRLVLKDAPDQDESENLARTRRNMEEKARLYAAMKRGDYVSKENETTSLIDFDRKWAEREDQKRGPSHISASSSESDLDDDDDDDENGLNHRTNTSMAGEKDANDIIEYEDEFGRLRRGTLSEIQRLERQRRRGLLGAEELERMSARPSAPSNLIYGDAIQTLAFVPDDPDKMEELAARRDRSATPPEAKHYDADSEIRTKGTGFYKFSQDEETRTAEMRSLEEERKTTEAKRREQEDKKAARRKEMEERRKKIEARRANKMADSFLEDLAAGMDGREPHPK